MSEGKQEKSNRRDFLKQAAAGLAALYTGHGSAGEEERTDGSNEEEIQKAVGDFSYQGNPEEAPGVGKYADKAAAFAILMLPRTKEEGRQYDNFIYFVHSQGFRELVAEQLVMKDADPELYGQVGREFYRKYIAGDPQVSIHVFPATPNQYMTRAGVMLDGSKAIIHPSVTLRHETDHGLQDHPEIDTSIDLYNPDEAISLFDGPHAVLIDLEARRRSGELEISKDAPLEEVLQNEYPMPVKFPSGRTVRIGQLAALAAQFYDIRTSEDFKRHVPDLYAAPEALQFFDLLIYGQQRNSAELVNKWRRAATLWEQHIGDKSSMDTLVMNYIARIEHDDIAKAEHWRQEYAADPGATHAKLVDELMVEDDPKYVFVYAKVNPQSFHAGARFVRQRTKWDVLVATIEHNNPGSEIFLKGFIEQNVPKIIDRKP